MISLSSLCVRSCTDNSRECILLAFGVRDAAAATEPEAEVAEVVEARYPNPSSQASWLHVRPPDYQSSQTTPVRTEVPE